MIEGVVLGCGLFAVIHWLKEAGQAGTRGGGGGVILRILAITQLSDHLLLGQLFRICFDFLYNILVLAESHASWKWLLGHPKGKTRVASGSPAGGPRKSGEFWDLQAPEHTFEGVNMKGQLCFFAQYAENCKHML